MAGIWTILPPKFHFDSSLHATENFSELSPHPAKFHNPLHFHFMQTRIHINSPACTNWILLSKVTDYICSHSYCSRMSSSHTIVQATFKNVSEVIKHLRSTVFTRIDRFRAYKWSVPKTTRTSKQLLKLMTFFRAILATQIGWLVKQLHLKVSNNKTSLLTGSQNY